MKIQQLLSKTPEQLVDYCMSLGDEDKQSLYKQIIEEAKGKRLKEVRQLNKIATVIEKTTNKDLLEPFDNDDNPFYGIAILNFFRKLSRHLFLVMHSSVYDEDLKELNELDDLLPQMYKELKPKLTSDLKSYAKKELKFSNFLRNNISTFKLLEKAKDGSVEERKKAAIELSKLFMSQSELYFQGDIFLLSLISEHIGVFRKSLKRQVDDFIASLEKGLEKLESIKEGTEEYREVENELMNARSKVIDELRCLVLIYVVFEETRE